MTAHHYKPIRSFVLRSRNLTEKQQTLLDTKWLHYGIEFSRSILSLEQIFGRKAPKILEIGSGMGDTIIELAKNNQENDYLAVEVHRPGIYKIVQQIYSNKLSNIKIISHDIIEILKYQLAANSIDNIYMFFPDPWPKKKHHKRRLMNTQFLTLLEPILKKKGNIFIATDWENYAQYIIQLLAENPNIINFAEDKKYSPRPKWRPITKFEKRGLQAGRTIYDIKFSYRN